MQVLVTGASGHIGANLVQELVGQGDRVTVLEHVHNRAFDALDITRVKGDVTDAASLSGAVSGADVVYHLAAVISIDSAPGKYMEKVNILGTRNVINECLAQKVKRLVHFSSVHAISDGPDSEKLGQVPLAHLSRHPAYNRSKAAAEAEVKKGIDMGLDTVVIRPTAVIGPLDYRPSYLGQAIIRLIERRLPALVSGGYDWVDVRDVVDGAIEAQRRAPAGSVYLLYGHWLSFCQLANMIEAITGIPRPRITCPGWLAYAAAPLVNMVDRMKDREPLFTPFSIQAMGEKPVGNRSKARRELGYQPRPFDQTLRDTIDWFIHNGLASPALPVSGVGL